RGSRSMRSLSASAWSRRWHIFSNMDAPGTSSTPPTITRPGSPHACASTAWIMEANRIALQPGVEAADVPGLHDLGEQPVRQQNAEQPQEVAAGKRLEADA